VESTGGSSAGLARRPSDLFTFDSLATHFNVTLPALDLYLTINSSWGSCDVVLRKVAKELQRSLLTVGEDAGHHSIIDSMNRGH
jgi:hypothetical protein